VGGRRLEARRAPQRRSRRAQRRSARWPSRSTTPHVRSTTGSLRSVTALVVSTFRDAQWATALGERPCAVLSGAIAPRVSEGRNVQSTLGPAVSGIAHAKSSTAFGVRRAWWELSEAAYRESEAAYRESEAALAERAARLEVSRSAHGQGHGSYRVSAGANTLTSPPLLLLKKRHDAIALRHEDPLDLHELRRGSCGAGLGRVVRQRCQPRDWAHVSA
jgi:hypothetical protein